MLFFVGLSSHVVILVDVEESDFEGHGCLLKLDNLVDRHLLDLFLGRLFAFLQLCKVSLLGDYPRHTVYTHHVLFASKEPPEDTLDVHHVAIYFLRRVKKRWHFCRPLLHKVQYLVFHLDVAFGSPSLNPLGNRQLHLRVRQFYPNCFSFDFELANDPEKENCFPAECVFFVLQTEPSQVSFSHRVQESIQSEQLEYALFDNLLLLAQPETYLSLVFLVLQFGDQGISLLSLLIFVLQTVL